jgi:hypothetical protein
MYRYVYMSVCLYIFMYVCLCECLFESTHNTGKCVCNKNINDVTRMLLDPPGRKVGSTAAVK